MNDLIPQIKRAQDGDHDAFARVVRRHYATALDVAWKFLGDFQQAEDAVQEALVRAFLDLPKLRDPAAFAGWFRRIVIGCCHRLVRGKSLPTVALDETFHSSEADPEHHIVVVDVRGRVWDAIRRLPERERPVVTLFYIDDFSQKEIADLLGISVSTANSRIYEARKRLREDLMNMDEDKRYVGQNQMNIPAFPIPEGFVNSDDYLRYLAKEGLHTRYGDADEGVMVKLERECEIVIAKGLADYFLVFYDLVLYAKNEGIMIGPGRGPVPGSLLAYVLGITDVDPIRYGLIFERFLHSERKGLPDIDLDVDPERREDLFEYLVVRYGEGGVSRLVPIGEGVRLTASAVLAPHDFVDQLPMYESPQGAVFAQLNETSCGEMGLMKIDLLGLQVLTFLEKLVQTVCVSDRTFCLNAIALDDKDALALFSEGDTEKVWGFELGETRELLQRLQPDCTEDVIALRGLLSERPDLAVRFVEGKMGKVTDVHDVLWPFLEDTYGVLVYQEQVMEIAHGVAGFSYTQADLMRRALGKDDTIWRGRFVDGCVENGVGREVGEVCYDLLSQAGRLLNKSHWVAYGVLSYWVGYFKVHFGEIFDEVRRGFSQDQNL